MDRSRVIVLSVAGAAAVVAALMVRNLLGHGTTKAHASVAPRPASTLAVLVARSDLQPGMKITPDEVKWQTWPDAAVSSSFITSRSPGNVSQIVRGTVARAPILSGQPLSTTNMVHAASAGFMSAQLMKGMRAVSIQISDSTGASGFILPNDRVDVLKTSNATGSGSQTQTILQDVRVLAIGQTYQQQKGEKVITGKTATLEVTPLGADALANAAGSGTLTLALRPLVDVPVAEQSYAASPINVIRYGITSHTGQRQD